MKRCGARDGGSRNEKPLLRLHETITKTSLLLQIENLSSRLYKSRTKSFSHGVSSPCTEIIDRTISFVPRCFTKSQQNQPTVIDGKPFVVRWKWKALKLQVRFFDLNTFWGLGFRLETIAACLILKMKTLMGISVWVFWKIVVIAKNWLSEVYFELCSLRFYLWILYLFWNGLLCCGVWWKYDLMAYPYILLQWSNMLNVHGCTHLLDKCYWMNCISWKLYIIWMLKVVLRLSHKQL